MQKSIMKKVLVVDDEEDIRNYLKMVLDDAGFSVFTAMDGADALQKLKATIPDLVSLDLVMPNHSGIKFFHELQKNKDWKNIPVLIVTGHAHDELGKVDFKTMIMSGPGVYLEKPVRPEKYIQTICGLLNIEIPERFKTEQIENTEKLRDELSKNLSKADPEALKRALEALRKK